MAWAVRQSGLTQQFPGAGLPGMVLAFTSTTLSGSLLVAIAEANDHPNSTTGAAVSDPTNGAWTALGTTADSGNDLLQSAIFYKENAGVVTNAQDVTLTYAANPGGQGADLTIIEITGIATVSSIDPATYGSTTGIVDGGASSGTVTDTLTTLVANDLYIVGFTSAQAQTWATPAGWTLVKQSGVLTSGLASASYFLTTTAQAAGTVNVTETATASTSILSKMGAWQIPGTAYLPPLDPIYVHRRT